MGKVEDYTSFMEKIANDNSHGYDQINRWSPDYDCSSLVITAVQNAGIPVKTSGATYTGNMLPVFTKCGFTDVTAKVNRATGAGLIRGDILLDVVNHTAVYCGNGKLVQASINENGGITGGRTGDQTGNEINIRSYYNYPWTNVLRYSENNSNGVGGNMKIGINCGHTLTGAGSGAVGFINESTETRKVGNELIRLLKNAGYTVVNCTVDKASTTGESLQKACDIANNNGVDLFVSIHFNAGGGKGVEVFTYKGEKHSEAVKACENIASLGFVNRGVKDGSDLWVINGTNMKAMLIECCFVDTKTDVDLYNKVGYAAISEKIFNAITGKSVTTSKKVETKKFQYVNAIVLGKNCIFTGFMENNENWIKATAALEAVGYTAKWDGNKKRVIAVKNGKETLLDIRTYISLDGISFCPLRELYEFLGYSVNWDADSKKISVNVKK